MLRAVVHDFENAAYERFRDTVMEQVAHGVYEDEFGFTPSFGEFERILIEIDGAGEYWAAVMLLRGTGIFSAP